MYIKDQCLLAYAEEVVLGHADSKKNIILSRQLLQVMNRAANCETEHGMNIRSTIMDEIFCNALEAYFGGLCSCEYRFDFSAKCKFLPSGIHKSTSFLKPTATNTLQNLNKYLSSLSVIKCSL